MAPTQTMRAAKPVLRSISTIDENENTYNNVNFKRRRLAPVEESSKEMETSPLVTNSISYNTTIDDDDDEDDLFATATDEEKIFNSDDDDYYSAISDYESDFKSSRFIMSKPANKLSAEEEHRSHMKLSQTNLLSGGNDLFDTDSESDSPLSPLSPLSSIMDSFGELKSLEENFQKIADKHQHPIESAPSPSPVEPTTPVMTLEDCLNYGDQSIDDISNTHLATKQKFLQYRHDERHNLAFPDVSTFPIRFDPMVNNISINVGSSGKRIRALNRRAILSGMASEMVGTGMAIADFDMF